MEFNLGVNVVDTQELISRNASSDSKWKQFKDKVTIKVSNLCSNYLEDILER